jgi:hypothetical protein
MAFIGVVFKGILDYKDLPFYHHFDAITLYAVLTIIVCRPFSGKMVGNAVVGCSLQK